MNKVSHTWFLIINYIQCLHPSLDLKDYIAAVDKQYHSSLRHNYNSTDADFENVPTVAEVATYFTDGPRKCGARCDSVRIYFTLRYETKYAAPEVIGMRLEDCTAISMGQLNEEWAQYQKDQRQWFENEVRITSTWVAGMKKPAHSEMWRRYEVGVKVTHPMITHYVLFEGIQHSWFDHVAMDSWLTITFLFFSDAWEFCFDIRHSMNGEIFGVEDVDDRLLFSYFPLIAEGYASAWDHLMDRETEVDYASRED